MALRMRVRKCPVAPEVQETPRPKTTVLCFLTSCSTKESVEAGIQQQQATTPAVETAHVRASLAGAYPNKAPMIGENDHVPNFEEQCRERQLLPQQGAQTSDNKNENPNGLPKSEQLLAVQTSLAEDLRQVIKCDIQMDCLSKKRSALLTQVLQNQNQPFQLIMVQQQSRSERKASRSPPNKKRRTMPQAAAGLPRASTSDSVGFPPVHPDLRHQARHDEDPQPRLPPQQGTANDQARQGSLQTHHRPAAGLTSNSRQSALRGSTSKAADAGQQPCAQPPPAVCLVSHRATVSGMAPTTGSSACLVPHRAAEGMAAGRFAHHEQLPDEGCQSRFRDDGHPLGIYPRIEQFGLMGQPVTVNTASTSPLHQAALQEEAAGLISAGCEEEQHDKEREARDILALTKYRVAAATPGDHKMLCMQALLQAKLIWHPQLSAQFAASLHEMSSDQVSAIFCNPVTFLELARVPVKQSANKNPVQKAHPPQTTPPAQQQVQHPSIRKRALARLKQRILHLRPHDLEGLMICWTRYQRTCCCQWPE